MHNYPVLSQDEPLTLNTCCPKVNQNRVFARSFFSRSNVVVLALKDTVFALGVVFKG